MKRYLTRCITWIKNLFRNKDRIHILGTFEDGATPYLVQGGHPDFSEPFYDTIITIDGKPYDGLWNVTEEGKQLIINGGWRYEEE